MKIAVCLKGHMRNMAVFASINALRDSHEVDVYIHTYDELGTKCSTTGQLYPKNGTIRPNSGLLDVHAAADIISPKKIMVENYARIEPILDELTEKYFYNWMPRDSVYPNTILSQMRQRAMCIDLIEGEYDCIIVTRPDVVFSFHNNQIPVVENSIGVSTITAPIQSHPAGGIWFDDLVLVANQESIKKVAKLYYELESAMIDLKLNNYIGIAQCMHQIQSYMFQHHAKLNLVSCDTLFSYIIK